MYGNFDLENKIKRCNQQNKSIYQTVIRLVVLLVMSAEKYRTTVESEKRKFMDQIYIYIYIETVQWWANVVVVNNKCNKSGTIVIAWTYSMIAGTEEKKQLLKAEITIARTILISS